MREELTFLGGSSLHPTDKEESLKKLSEALDTLEGKLKAAKAAHEEEKKASAEKIKSLSDTASKAVSKSKAKEIAMEEMQDKIEDMKQELVDAGFGNLAERIWEKTGLDKFERKKGAVSVFDRLYKDAVKRCARSEDRANPTVGPRGAQFKRAALALMTKLGGGAFGAGFATEGDDAVDQDFAQPPVDVPFGARRESTQLQPVFPGNAAAGVFRNLAAKVTQGHHSLSAATSSGADNAIPQQRVLLEQHPDIVDGPVLTTPGLQGNFGAAHLGDALPPGSQVVYGAQQSGNTAHPGLQVAHAAQQYVTQAGNAPHPGLQQYVSQTGDMLHPESQFKRGAQQHVDMMHPGSQVKNAAQQLQRNSVVQQFGVSALRRPSAQQGLSHYDQRAQTATGYFQPDSSGGFGLARGSVPQGHVPGRAGGTSSGSMPLDASPEMALNVVSYATPSSASRETSPSSRAEMRRQSEHEKRGSTMLYRNAMDWMIPGAAEGTGAGPPSRPSPGHHSQRQLASSGDVSPSATSRLHTAGEAGHPHMQPQTQHSQGSLSFSRTNLHPRSPSSGAAAPGLDTVKETQQQEPAAVSYGSKETDSSPAYVLPPSLAPKPLPPTAADTFGELAWRSNRQSVYVGSSGKGLEHSASAPALRKTSKQGSGHGSARVNLMNVASPRRQEDPLIAGVPALAKHANESALPPLGRQLVEDTLAAGKRASTAYVPYAAGRPRHTIRQDAMLTGFAMEELQKSEKRAARKTMCADKPKLAINGQVHPGAMGIH
eukprot:gnl/TRDRNA2_/TRDRNA2_140078_c2_seq1.p1 gnl/TRDRNA2_/TRDRNA2_140078_c2~~gnl/TRDRNA2_/TRDRNA2_140078_c2_seq1.p1  ORF type:complete len:897 (+),score=188.80 gnl/TRDRNA2_/TRDRNA2_140078_c2_seq1:385-2691(+)